MFFANSLSGPICNMRVNGQSGSTNRKAVRITQLSKACANGWGASVSNEWRSSPKAILPKLCRVNLTSKRWKKADNYRKPTITFPIVHPCSQSDCRNHFTLQLAIKIFRIIIPHTWKTSPGYRTRCRSLPSRRVERGGHGHVQWIQWA